MIDNTLFFHADGAFTNEKSRNDGGGRDFVSTGQKDASGNEIVKPQPTKTFGQKNTSEGMKLQPTQTFAQINNTSISHTASTPLQQAQNGQNSTDWDSNSADLEDIDFAHVLDNLPTSYDDFESKELHLKLERNLSSPLITCQSPNADSGRVSAGSSLTKSTNLCDIGSNPLDADDLEVAMINQSFEEQQKQTRLYASPGLKDLFYSQPNTTASDDHSIFKSFEKDATNCTNHSLLVVSDTHRLDSNEKTSLFGGDLFFSGAQGIISGDSFTVASPWTVLQGPVITKPLETNPEAVNCYNMQDITKSPLSNVTVGGNVLESALEEPFCDPFAALNTLTKLPETKLYVDPVPMQDFSTASATDDATEMLAMNLIESLFSKKGPEEASFTECAVNQDLKEVTTENKDPTKSDLSELNTLKGAGDRKDEHESNVKKSDTDVIKNDAFVSKDTVDSWEELYMEENNVKIINEIETALSKMRIRKPPVDCFAKPDPAPWDDDLLPHVLEAYNLPAKFDEEYVRQELAVHNCADVYIHIIDETHCFVVFNSKDSALRALIAIRRRQSISKLRMRPLRDAGSATQEKARKYKSLLVPYKQRPQTTPLVARRLVESALGRRSNVSAQQISEERKQLQNAKGMKQAKAAVWEDGP